MIQNYPSYPRRIIGRPNYEPIDKIGFLSQRGFYVGRTTLMSKDQFSLESIKESFKSGSEIKDSTIKNGISVNLLSVYKKKDMKFLAIEDKDNPRFHVPMELGKNGVRPMPGEYTFDVSKLYYGFKIASLKTLEIETTYKAKGITPTKKNTFWHRTFSNNVKLLAF